MEISILRFQSNENGTNGKLSIDGVDVCETIELPWKNNDKGLSCIPEGRYEVVKRVSEKHGKHLLVKDVPERSLILFHPANNAIQELRGCIAPVSKTTGIGKGILSRAAFNKVRDLAYQAFSQNEKVFLTI